MTCCSTYDEKSRRIDVELRRDSAAQKSEFKLLLLGAGESGKSTLAKQMKIIHTKDRPPFSDEEIAEFVPVIHSNVIQSVAAVLDFMAETGLKVKSKHRKFAEDVALVAANGDTEIGRKLKKKIQALIDDPSFKKALDQQHKFQFPEQVLFFFRDLDRIAAPDYVPSLDDILSSRRRTTGVREFVFKTKNQTFRLVDVGGQRSERKKWFHFFEGVTAVIFVTAISEYNLTMFEDSTSNRMHDSLTLFREIANSQWFVKSAIILFLNKIDLFRAKLKRFPLRVCFEDYAGGDGYNECLDYIKSLFLAVRDSKATIFVHPTCATDTENIRVVFAAIQQNVLNRNLDRIV